VTHEKREINKRVYDNYKQNRDVDRLFYMTPLKDALPFACDKVLYAFYDFESIQNTRYTDEATLHVPKRVYVQQFCSRRQAVLDGDRVRCGKRKHSFWDYPFGELLSYLTEPRS